MLIKDLPNDEKPRERLLKYGVENLSNEDLISIILKSGTKSKSVKEMSLELLNKFNNIGELNNLNINYLCKIKGINTVKAIELIASLELGKRVFLYNDDIKKTKIKNSNDIFLYFKNIFKNTNQEKFYCIYLDIRKNIIEIKLLFIGTVNTSVIHPRDIFKYAHLNSACYIVCVHNHPSGDVEPSEIDINVTKELKNIGEIQKIVILDHIIVGNDKYFSFFENNLL